MKIGIGIDTGGTYTDAVAYDFDTRAVLASGKSLTTGEDVSLGILRALDQLPSDLTKEAEVIGLSTTLVTNACVQDRLGKGRLVFFGDNRDVLIRYGEEYGLPPFDEILYVDMKSDFSGMDEPEPDWAAFDKYLDNEIVGAQGVGILEMNAMRHGAVVEKEARRRIREKYPYMSVICGHELFDMLNSLQRGASTLLNTNLLPVMGQFLDGFQKAIKERGIKADTVIMRSDGSLMSEASAAGRPIDTILCGPAASLMGGARLTGKSECIVVDMGGTTTDIAIMKNGLGESALGGVRIGRWKTFVDGLYVRTFGLGGDTAVHYRRGRLILEDYRVVPICVASTMYPSVADYVKKMLPAEGRHTKYLHEHLIFRRDPEPWMQLTSHEKSIVGALKDGPLSLRQIADDLGLDLYSLPIDRLVAYGVVSACGLTPTDIMHIRGDFRNYDKDAAQAAAEFVALNLNITVDELCDRVYDEVKWRMYRNIVLAIMGRKDLVPADEGPSDDLERLLRYSYEQCSQEICDANNSAQYAYDPAQGVHVDCGCENQTASPCGRENPDMLTHRFTTSYPLVGIGAPIQVFLPDVAKLLGTEAIIPEHHEVANAVGAIVGSISVTVRTKVEPVTAVGESNRYIVYAAEGNREFNDGHEALAFAIEDACRQAREEAVRRGATEGLKVSYELDSRRTEANGLTVDLGTTVVAHAIGNML